MLPSGSTFQVDYTLQHNFGELEVDWQSETLKASLYGDGGVELLSRTVPLAILRGDNHRAVSIGDDNANNVVCRGVAPEWQIWAFLATIAACIATILLAILVIAGRAVLRCPRPASVLPSVPQIDGQVTKTRPKQE